MLEAFVITLREGLEAFLIVALSLAYVRKSGRPHLAAAVYWGVVAGVAVSVSAGVLLYSASNREWLDGPLALVSAFLVGAMAAHMWNAGRRMKTDLEGHLASSELSVPAGAFIGVLLFTVLMISREGMETVLLLLQIRNTAPLAVGAVAGTLTAASIGWLSTRYGVRLNLSLFFQMTTIFLFVFVTQLVIKGVHEMAEQRQLPYSASIHAATESWGPDSAFGHLLTYLLVLLPLGWLLLARILRRPAARVRATRTPLSRARHAPAAR